MILVTGSSGHLGEALMRTLRERGIAARGIDITPSAWTDAVGSIAERAFVRAAMAGATQVLHTATLHKPHLATHGRQDFIDTNVSGTLNLLEEAAGAGVRAFVCTSTTSAFGRALSPAENLPAAWITEATQPLTKNIYGVTKIAAENLCELMQRLTKLPCLVLRTSRFFPEDDDDAAKRAAHPSANLQANEFLHRRVDIEDVVEAHLCALEAAPRLGFGRYIVSATTPFRPEDAAELRRDAAAVVRRRVAGWEDVYAAHGWTPFTAIDRVYDNAAARRDLGWQPRTDFAAVVARLRRDGDIRSALARTIGRKGYHPQSFGDDAPYPTA
jgi:UDP-glucose 4-epimerase